MDVYNMANKKLKEKIRFLKHSVKWNGKKTRVRYSQGSYTKESGLPQGTITIYAKDYVEKLPAELKPINQTDLMTDYFETDKASVVPKSKYYKDVKKALEKSKKLF